MRYSTTKLLLCVAFISALAACNQPITHYPQPTAEEIAQEEQRQHQVLSQLAKQGGAPRPWRKNKTSRKRFDRVADRIEKAGAKLCQEMGLPKHDMRCYYYFETSRKRAINAQADGERIIINNGMRKFVNNDDELALVMAHELAHNLMGHVVAMENNALIGMMIGAAVQGAANAHGISGDYKEDGALIGAVAFSPSFEREADYIGLYILARAGYNTKRAIKFWRRLTTEDPEGMYASITHPSNPERFAILKKTVEEIAQKRKNREQLIPNMIENE